MKASTIKWHLARDSQIKLFRFCDRNKTSSICTPNAYEIDGKHYFTIKYSFDNGSYITAELLHGDNIGYSIADHFQVVDYLLLGAMYDK